MLISIIVPVYNAEKYLKNCVESIIRQTITDLEIILIDDGSKDLSSQICDELAKEDKRVKVIHQENMGVSAVRNVGLDIAKGQYIGFVDSDDYIDEDMFEYLLKIMKENNCEISCCNFSKSCKTVTTKNDNKTTVYDSKASLMELALDRNINGYLWNKLINRNLFESMRFCEDISISEDKLILWELLKKCNRVCVSDKVCYHYIQHEESLCNSQFSKKRLDILKVNMKILNEAQKLFPENFDILETKIIEQNIRTSLEISNANYYEKDVILEISSKMKKTKIKNLMKIQNRKSWIIYGILIKINFNLFRFFYKIVRKER